MNAKSLTIIVIFVTNLKFCQSKRYDNYTLYNMVPTNLEHLKFLRNLETQKYIDVMFWMKPTKLYNYVQLIVNPKDKELFLERVDHFKIDTTVVLEDVQKAFDKQTVRRYHRLQVESFSWNHYHSLEDIYQWLADIALKFSSFVELSSIGKSAEGRDIYAVGIKKTGTHTKAIVEGGIHGNEWITVSFVTYLIHELIYAEAHGDKNLIDVSRKYQWYLIPVVNPDGYYYSHNKDRMWRKNRRNLDNGRYGVDLNRNFNYNFGSFGASGDPKDDYYCGPNAFSEPESRALADFISSKKNNLKFYFSFHAYGQKIIIPYSDRVNHLENFSEMDNYGKQAILKMYKMTGVKYAIGTIYDTMGIRTSGNTASWVKRNFKVQYVITFVLRDNGNFGYALPPDKILPACRETLTGLVELMTARPRYMRANLFSSSIMLQASALVVISSIVLTL